MPHPAKCITTPRVTEYASQCPESYHNYGTAIAYKRHRMTSRFILS